MKRRITIIRQHLTSGYCINCKRIIKYNINQPLCSGCSSHNFAPAKEMKYCHYCGKASANINGCEPCGKCCRPLNEISSDYEKDLYEYSELIKNYSCIIEPLWELKENSKNKLIIIDTLKFITEVKFTTKMDSTKRFQNKETDNIRILNILRLWNRKQTLSPPEVFIRNGSYCFKDGQHRSIAAYYLDAPKIPIYVLNHY